MEQFFTPDQFFLTRSTPCPYLPERSEQKLFTYLDDYIGASHYDQLSQQGFRRSQIVAYKPLCQGCQACISVRVRVADFRPTRTMRRIWSRNANLISHIQAAEATSEQHVLFQRYMQTRHSDSEMAQLTFLDYMTMVEMTHVDTQIAEYRLPDATRDSDDHALIAVALSDQLADGLSMVYSFYDPEAPARSLGTWMILEHIQRAKILGLPYVYLGYRVQNSEKMAYKSRFKPQEGFINDQWARIDE